MCGIAGFVPAADDGTAPAAEAVRRMAGRMRLRGPDAEGLWTGNGVVLGHRRLAILDLDARSNQPMLSPGSEYAIVFNGEIYNFRELKSELEAAGAVFHTTSDTEVLLELYAREGDRMLPRLRGMFAFAIWDLRRHELFLARDPYGIKPLFYAQTAEGLVFASQVKAILASALVAADAEPAGVAGFYLWGSVPEPWTLYRGVFALPCGHWMRVRRGKAEAPVCWDDIRDNWRQPAVESSAGKLKEIVRNAVTDSVRAHLISDVPVSVFLSGGIDSGTIAGLISQLGGNVEGITVGFDEFSARQEDEVPVAAALAEHYGLPHHVRRISRAEFEQDIPHILDAMDQPSIDGVNTWFAAKAAVERGYKVVLSGVGGDELFYGYSLMKELPESAAKGRTIAAIPGARLLVKAGCALLANGNRHPKLKGIADFMDSLEGVYFLKRCLFLPQELPLLMGEEKAREGLARLGGSPPGMTPAKAITGAAGVCLLDSTHYLRNQLLRDSDWASMAHSLELRTPLVDAALLHALRQAHSGFAGGVGKRLLAQSPVSALPDEIVNRPKTGFGVPMTDWLAQASERREWNTIPLLAAKGTPWTRRWARIVLEEGFNGGM
ncbi:MAG TPA: asparagine synthase (glutamine-hydrolyzing) [Terracidiphilus sp.]|nr:asparagine synthase (glutamine-hydrolyzing) [Terracidiphilus sp.]